ncbi:hypothetical protein E1289_12800 [Actinomadura sp. 6K520]|nr:hypothetical protein E1289_12800 [Actinomadura sp. 6K520]
MASPAPTARTAWVLFLCRACVERCIWHPSALPRSPTIPATAGRTDAAPQPFTGARDSRSSQGKGCSEGLWRSFRSPFPILEVDGEPTRPTPTRPGRTPRRRPVRPWTGEAARFLTDLFDQLAATWDTGQATGRDEPLRDALARGGPLPVGPCPETGTSPSPQSRGKAPLGVASAAARAGVPVIAVCGRRSSPTTDSARPISPTPTLMEIEDDPNQCIVQAAHLLERLGEQIAADWLPRLRQDVFLDYIVCFSRARWRGGSGGAG